MYLIASTKLRRARSELEQTRPYFNALRSEIKRIFRTANDVDSPYFYPRDREPELFGTYGCLALMAVWRLRPIRDWLVLITKMC